MRLNTGIIKTYGSSNITTDNLTEGALNKYYTQQRVSDFLDSVKAVPNGIASLDGSGKVPANQIPSFPVGSVFYGLDIDKINPISYPVTSPIIGDRYIATDSGLQYVLVADPYTLGGNWVLLSTGGVNSVNAQTGIVSLTTDDIP